MRFALSQNMPLFSFLNGGFHQMFLLSGLPAFPSLLYVWCTTSEIPIQSTSVGPWELHFSSRDPVAYNLSRNTASGALHFEHPWVDVCELAALNHCFFSRMWGGKDFSQPQDLCCPFSLCVVYLILKIKTKTRVWWKKHWQKDSLNALYFGNSLWISLSVSVVYSSHGPCTSPSTPSSSLSC